MNCMNCGAPLILEWEKEYFFCEFCKTIHIPEPNKDYVRSMEFPSELNCPVCRQQLVQALLDQTHVLHCTKCKGILVDTFAFFPTILFIRGRIARFELPPRLLQQQELEREIQCPKCHEIMDTHPYAGPGNVVIDTCNKCGLNWLDYGEFFQAVNASRGEDINWYW
jgi:Zn-finger nucleic acid-binding protein